MFNDVCESSLSPPYVQLSQRAHRCIFGACHCKHGSINNLPTASPLLSFNALNSEMGATCPIVTDPSMLMPQATVTMTTYNGTLSPAGGLYGIGHMTHDNLCVTRHTIICLSPAVS